MRTVVLGPRPPEVERLTARRRSLGLDTYDEIWEGDYHMTPAPSLPHSWLDTRLTVILDRLAREAGLVMIGAFNLGEPANFRVPDHGLLRQFVNAAFLPTAAMIVEIVSPDDETLENLSFYASRGVDEVLLVFPEDRSVRWLRLEGGRYTESHRSELLGEESAGLAQLIEWPSTEM